MNPRIGMDTVKDEDWIALPGFDGLEQVILSGTLDEAHSKGRRIRLVRFAPGMKTGNTLVHEYFEETYLVSGSLQVEGDPASRIEAPAFVSRPPGTPHGPFRSDDGCVMLEIHYFA